MLNEIQKNILIEINEFINREGIPPTVRENGQAVGLTSSSSVHSNLNKLEMKGYITKRKDSPRSIRVLKSI
ncbi:LexA family protein [Clostridium hominis]|nr:transcriptional regulator [Clostridium hominis]